MDSRLNYDYILTIMNSYEGLILNIKGEKYKLELTKYQGTSNITSIVEKELYGLKMVDSNGKDKCICVIDEFKTSDKKEVINYINSAIKYRLDNIENKKRYFTRHLENVREEIYIELAIELKNSDVEIIRLY